MSGKEVKIAWFGKHFGEEPPLVGNETQGAGGIFFSGCNLRCVFCQNFQISQQGIGKYYSVAELAKIMTDLQSQGAVNIDLVTPTIWWKQIAEAVALAKQNGLAIPVVWNSNAYEAVAILRRVEDVVDVYLPDFKYGDDTLALKYSGIRKYSEVAIAAIREMLKQKGNFDAEKNKGVIVRHLILPGCVENSIRALELLAEINPNLHISLMRQYVPVHKACDFPEINRRVTDEEFTEVYNALLDLGFENGWVQDEEDASAFLPDFTKAYPFQK